MSLMNTEIENDSDTKRQRTSGIIRVRIITSASGVSKLKAMMPLNREIAAWHRAEKKKQRNTKRPK